ncbi:N-acetyl-alpha-D-glucosaminyl L-malate synthase [Fundidesulfovibrio magnetotacticus]|uniref:N-acetyl-alpha-D-glucosaminyl L-malate synthase n=1 Tax=Fundidesulfovibrio magnetotacticus TaxID=2730080 RepID=A0A6V8LTA5_9BACT|nr:glycosyltransferase family 4 protein [Fundidesulfovibrio magnetotacticus]GFK94180.1 N-acetyl-alpha-D-glucosaminyl L-malate synthase [Fundidesulfovibrio magnetotacticus]
MKIAQLCHHFADSLGGLEVCVHNVSQRLALAGHHVSLYCCGPGRLPFRPPYRLRAFPRLYKVRQTYPLSKWAACAFVAAEQLRLRYDVWQVNGGYPYGAYLSGLFARLGVPAVLRCSGEDIQAEPDIGYGYRLDPELARLIERGYPRYDALVAISETVTREYLALGVPGERIARIPNGVDVERLAAPRDRQAVREAHGIPRDAKVLLTVGRNHPKKNYRIIPALLDGLLDAGHDAWWLVAGRGVSALDAQALAPERRRRLVLVEELGAPPRDFSLPPDALLDLYKAADVFVMTSLLETFGIVLLEALAAGLPLVCFDAPGVRDVAHPGVARVCPLGDQAAMARALHDALIAPDTPEALRARLDFARDHSWDRVARDYAALYASLARSARENTT